MIKIKSASAKSALGVWVALMISVISAVVTTSCGYGPDSNSQTNIYGFVAITDPTNGQVVPTDIPVYGSVYDSSTNINIGLYLTPIYGGITNTLIPELDGNGLVLFRGTFEGLDEGFYYIWAAVNRDNGVTFRTKAVMVQAQSGIEQDLTPPTIAITEPVNMQVVGSSWSFSGTVVDSGSGVDKVYVQLDAGGYSTASVNGSVWSVNFSTTRVGYHTNKVYATDMDGNTSAVKSVIVNYQAGIPSVSIDNPQNGSTWNVASMTVSGSASVDSPYTISRVELKVNSGSFANVGNTTWQMTGVSLNEGANTLQARAIASNGKTNTSAVITVYRDTTGPTVSFTAPADGFTTTNGNITVSGTASDSQSTVSAVYMKVDSGSFVQLNGTTSWSLALNLTVGTHTVYVYAKDSVNNFSATNTRSFTVQSGGVTAPDVSASPTSTSFTTATLSVTLKLTGTGITAARYTLDGTDPSLSGTTFTNNQTISVGADITTNQSKTLRMYAINSGGSDTASYTYTKVGGANKPYYMNPTLGQGVANGAITIDGANTGGEWSEANLIYLDMAGDDPRTLGENWSCHECPWDLTHLYAAWDDNYLYLAWQYVDVTDIVDPANAGSSAGTKPNQMNLIQWIVIDIVQGQGASLDMWGKNLGAAYWTGTDKPEMQIYIPSNLYNSGYVSTASNNAFVVKDPAGTIDYYRTGTQAGIIAAVANNLASSSLWGVTDCDNRNTPALMQNFVASGHAGTRDTFYEMKIPWSALSVATTVNRAYVETYGVGIMLGQGETSCLDTIPNDPATTDTPGVSESNSPLEWADSDAFTTDFARVGHYK